MADSRKNVPPCVHGEVCRAYMSKFGMQSVDGMRQDCILSVDCQNCRYYEPMVACGNTGGAAGNTVMQQVLLLAT